MYSSPIATVAAISGDTNNVTTGSINTTGADLIVIVLGALNGTTVTISDNKGNTWNALTKRTSEANDCRMFWSRPTTVGSGHTFTASSTGATPGISVAAFSGSLASPFDVENGFATSGGGGQSTVQPGSVTPTLDNELIVTGMANNNGGTASINLSFSLGATAGASNPVVTLAYLIQTTAAAKNPTWTPGGNDYISSVIATFKGTPPTGGVMQWGTHGNGII